MNTAPAGQSQTKRGSHSSRRHKRREHSEKEDFAVLIRLPALQPVVSAPAETHKPAPDSAPAVAATPASDPHPEPTGFESRPGADREPVSHAALAAPSRMDSFNPLTSVRLLGQLALALLLIGLFVAAYLVMVGGSTPPTADKQADAEAADRAPAKDDTLPTKAPAGTQEKKVRAANPSADATPRSLRTDVTPPSPPALTLIDSPPEQPAPASVEPDGPELGPSAPAAADATRAEPLLGRSRADDAQDPSGDPAAAYPTAAESPAEPLRSGNRQIAAYPQTLDQSVGPTENYPITDPRTFRYPADYHEVLRARAGVQPPGDGTSGPVERSASPGGPRNARLQPRIEAPPLR